MCWVINCEHTETVYSTIMKDIEMKPGHCLISQDERRTHSKRFHNLTFNNIQAFGLLAKTWAQLDNDRKN